MITAEVSGKLLRWQQDVGTLVEDGAQIAEIETEAGRIPVCAPVAGRLTEMIALPGDTVEAGMVIGWIDALTDMEAPQPLSALIEPPTAPERKLKPRRKKAARRFVRLTSRWWVMLGLLLAMGMGASLALLVPVRSEVAIQGVATVPVIVTPTQFPPAPTPRFRLQDRVVPRDTIDGFPWGTQAIVVDSGYVPESGTWYRVRFGDQEVVVGERQIESVSVLAPTPTMRYDFRAWNWAYPLMLREPVADFPAGTRVQISSGTFNGVDWELQVITENGVSLNVREAQLVAPPDAPTNPALTPTAGF